MKGLITSFDAIKKVGHIQDESGHIYSFNYDSFAKDEDRDIVSVGMSAKYDVNDNICCDLTLLNIDEFNADKIKYVEPDTVQILEDDLVEGYEIIDKARYKIVKGDRSIEKARYRLIEEVKSLGGNVILNSFVKTEIKNSMGYAFEYFYVYGLPAVIAKVDEKGSLTRKNLSEQLNHVKADKLGNMIENQKVAKIVLKILGGILLVIFTLGFIFTS